MVLARPWPPRAVTSDYAVRLQNHVFPFARVTIMQWSRQTLISERVFSNMTSIAVHTFVLIQLFHSLSRGASSVVLLLCPPTCQDHSFKFQRKFLQAFCDELASGLHTLVKESLKHASVESSTATNGPSSSMVIVLLPYITCFIHIHS